MNVWHRVQHGFGADALFGVQQGNDKRFELRTLEHQPAHEVGAAVAEKAGADHLEGSQSGSRPVREHVVHPPGHELGVARGIAERHRELRDLQCSLDDQGVDGPGTGEARVHGR